LLQILKIVGFPLRGDMLPYSRRMFLEIAAANGDGVKNPIGSEAVSKNLTDLSS
jgi:hypothetical protein